MKLTFKSTDKFYIEIDNLGNHTLTEVRVSEKGAEYTKPVGHYRNVKQAVEKLTELIVLENSEEMEIIDYLKSIEHKFNKLIGEID